MKLKDLCSSERPRERIVSLGAKALSDGELLAILLRCGTKTHNATDVARLLLAECGGSLARVFSQNKTGLCRIPGIGPDKAATIMAAAELGRRFMAEKSAEGMLQANEPRIVYSYMSPLLKGIDHEEFWVLPLDRRCRILGRKQLTSGTRNNTAIDPGQVARCCLESGASGCIMVHNHPSGSPEPSRADISETQKTKAALDACGLELIDHVIIGEGSYFSFADEEITAIR